MSIATLAAVLLWLHANLAWAARYSDAAAVGEQVNCSGRQLSRREVIAYDEFLSAKSSCATKYFHKYWVVDWKVDDFDDELSKDECENKIFLYSPPHGDWVVPSYKQADVNWRTCAIAERGERGHPKYCEFEEGSFGWKQAVQQVEEKCFDQLCDLAKTGRWREGGWFKRMQAKKMPWKRKMQKSLGYEEAFQKCWTGGEKTGRLLPEFDAFVKKYRLSTEEGNFDKAACL